MLLSAREGRFLGALCRIELTEAGRRKIYNRCMSTDRARLHGLVDALAESQLPAALSFLTELGDEEVIEAETAAKLDSAIAEPGEDIPLEEVRRRLGL